MVQRMEMQSRIDDSHLRLGRAEEVFADQIVKGYEFEKDKWVTLKDEDFEKVKIENTHSVEITDFVEQAQINPKFFYKPYFLEPQRRWREKLRAFASRAVGHRQDRRSEGRDFQARIPCGGQTGRAVSDPGADALRA